MDAAAARTSHQARVNDSPVLAGRLRGRAAGEGQWRAGHVAGRAPTTFTRPEWTPGGAAGAARPRSASMPRRPGLPRHIGRTPSAARRRAQRDPERGDAQSAATPRARRRQERSETLSAAGPNNSTLDQLPGSSGPLPVAEPTEYAFGVGRGSCETLSALISGGSGPRIM
jgi:hypothetical protein